MNEAAQFAAANPPRCITTYAYVVVDTKEDYLAGTHVTFKLACAACGSETFQVLGFPIVAPDPSPYAYTEPGEIVFRPPHKTKCGGCGREAILFDPMRDGSDAITAEGLSGYEIGSGQEGCLGSDDARFRLHVLLGYSAYLDELEEVAQDYSCSAADLFDNYCCDAHPIDGGEVVEIQYECA